MSSAATTPAASHESAPARNQLSFALEADAYDQICQCAESLASLKELIEQFGTGPIDVTGNGLASLLGCINDRLGGSLKMAVRCRS